MSRNLIMNGLGMISFKMQANLKIFSAATLGAFVFVGSVQGAEMPDEYTLYCKGEQSTGFSWQENNWVQTRYKPEEYIVSKWNTNSCLEFIANPPKKGEHYKEVCINIRKKGEDYRSAISEKCTEYTTEKEAIWSDYISCDGLFDRSFKAKLDGWFHMANIHNSLDAKKEYKDSQYVEVGTCIRIK